MTLAPFLVFAVLATAALAVDLFVQKGRALSLGRAVAWSLGWIALSLGYAGYLYVAVDRETAHLFLAGYVLEKVLSVDNLIVFIAVFKFFKMDADVPGSPTAGLQHRVLYLGVVGAIVFRAVFVGAGSVLLAAGPWADVLFGSLVAYSAWKMLSGGGDDDGDEGDEAALRKGAEQADNWLVRQARRLYPVLPRFVGTRFAVTEAEARAAGVTEEELATARGSVKGARFLTPAFIALLTIEASDVLFSFDSVPTVIAVTRRPLVIYSAMIFAVLGLRSMYFVLAAASRSLVYLEKAILGLLFFVAGKMFLHASHEIFHRPSWDITPNQSLVVILAALTVGIVASLVAGRRGAAP